jgi:hypothetical protein
MQYVSSPSPLYLRADPLSPHHHHHRRGGPHLQIRHPDPRQDQALGRRRGASCTLPPRRRRGEEIRRPRPHVDPREYSCPFGTAPHCHSRKGMGSRGPSHRQACAIVRRMRQDRNTATRASFATYTKKETKIQETNKQTETRRERRPGPHPPSHASSHLSLPDCISQAFITSPMSTISRYHPFFVNNRAPPPKRQERGPARAQKQL